MLTFINTVMRSTARCREVYEQIQTLRESDWEVARMAVKLAQKRARQLTASELITLTELGSTPVAVVCRSRFSRLESLGLAVGGAVYSTVPKTYKVRLTPMGRVVLQMLESGEVRRG